MKVRGVPKGGMPQATDSCHSTEGICNKACIRHVPYGKATVLSSHFATQLSCHSFCRNHGMLLAANMLGLSVTGNTWQRTATSPARLGSKGVTRGLILADTAFKATRSLGQRDDGSGRSSARAAANSTVCQSAANADDDDIFTPGADAGGVDWQLSEDSSGVVQLLSRVVSDKLLVAPSHALVRRRRHGRRYTTD